METSSGCSVVAPSRLHRSAVNRSAARRLAIGPRFTIPIARIDHDTLFPGHRAILVSGRDYMGFNRLTTPPADS